MVDGSPRRAREVPPRTCEEIDGQQSNLPEMEFDMFDVVPYPGDDSPAASNSTVAIPAANAVDIAAVVRKRMLAEPHPALREVQCGYRGGVLTLWGVVPSYYVKQIAISIASDMQAGRVVADRLEVRYSVRRELPGLGHTGSSFRISDYPILHFYASIPG